MKVLILHDIDDLGFAIEDRLTHQDHEVERLTDPDKLDLRIYYGIGDYDAVILHLNFGQAKINIPDLVSKLHRETEHVRVIAVSGDYPYGQKEVISMGFDGYCHTDIESTRWIVEELSHGYLNPDEISMRKISVSTPIGREGNNYNPFRPEFLG